MLAIKDAVMVVVDYIIEVFKQGIENIKLLFSALSKLVTGDFQGAWDDVVKSFTESVALLRKPFDEFMQWVMGLFANLDETIKNTISNAASNAWNATKSFLGFGEDEQLQSVTGGGNGGMSPDGIPYGMNAAVGLAGGGMTSNSNVSQQNTIHINTSDPVVAGNTAADNLQQNMKDANRLSGRGGALMGIFDGLMQAQSSGKNTVKKLGIGGFSLFARVSDATEYPPQVPVDVLEDGSNASDDIINGPLTISSMAH